MHRRAGAALPLITAVVLALGGSAFAAEVSDAQALAIVQKHCGPCHTRNPTHPAFDKPPKDIVLDTTADLRKYAARVLEQVEDRTMPLGNETDMTDEDRETLARWINAPNERLTVARRHGRMRGGGSRRAAGVGCQ